ncbi:MAG: family 10 glycosylhydrolase [Clostridia bacterium]|nr:family 10 glycosylhydrolase [Clostridia bacterium]
MKRLLALLLTVLLIAAPMTASASPFFDRSFPIAGFNNSRGENELIIYTTADKPTGTNVYGYEAVVDENGTVIVVGGNNNVVPVGGFVVSAHGDAAAQLRATVKLGMRADYDASTVYFTYDADSLRRAVSYILDETATAISDAKAQFVYADYFTAEETLASCRTRFDDADRAYRNGGTDTAFESALSAIIDELTATQNSLCNSYTVQYRGVWVRPSQSSAEEVKTYVKSLYDAGINTISVEGCFANSVIMNVPDGSLFQKNPAFSFDVLQAYIDACHELRMELHLWMPVMKVGNNSDGDSSLHLLNRKPEWASLNQNGTVDNPDGFAMVDPANEEARAYLVDFYRYLVETYEIDCLELDYIRYYATSSELDFGYTQAAFDGFEAAYGYGVTPTYDRKAAYWDDWVQYRRDCVTAMVREVRAMLKEVGLPVLLSADVAYPTAHACDKIYQDFPTWLDEELLHIIHPMAYGDGYADEIAQTIDMAGDKCMVVPGLGVQSASLGAVEMEKQARENAALGAYGEFYFEARSFIRDGADLALNNTIYRNRAIAPFFNAHASIKTSLAYMQAHLDTVIRALGGVTAEEAAAVNTAIDTVLRTLPYNNDFYPEALVYLHRAVDAIENDAARQALLSDLYRVEQPICVERRLTASQLQVSLTPAYSKTPTWLFILIDVALTVIAIAGAVYVYRHNKQKEGQTE